MVVGAGVEAGVGGNVITGVGIGVSVHTPLSKRARTFVIARVPPLTGATDRGRVLVSEPLLLLELTDALCA